MPKKPEKLDTDVGGDISIPGAPYRPGETPDFSELEDLPQLETRPAPDVDASEIRDAAFGIIRVMSDDSSVGGPWQPEVTPSVLIEGLAAMLRTRLFDERMLRAQRQGKISFYVTCTGEEAVSVGQAMALEPADMLFPTYRQQGLLFARGRSAVPMMCHCFSNTRDDIKGRQIPGFYSWKKGRFFTISGNLATQFSQAVGWAMASAHKREPAIASGWVGEGSTAEGDFHYALTFASVYNAPVILNIVNNQWAISSYQSIAGGARAPFAARAIGYGIPGFRVDGNDFLAVLSATRWAAERARAGQGPTLLELFTYRAGAHSTSDDPSRYRPREEAAAWPFGDPIERLKTHLIGLDAWSETQHDALRREIEEEIQAAYKEAESYGTLEQGQGPSTREMFEDVYAEPLPHLRRQRQELGV